MNYQDRLSNLILTHWQNYHPKMVAQFQKENRLEAELEATAQRFNDLLYNLTVEQKLDYKTAWEVVSHQILLPEEESSLTSQSQN